MSFVTILLLSLLSGFAYFSRRFLGDWFLERPIVLAPLTGLIMGDFHTGLLIGGALELIFMGAADIGGTVPPNYTIGSILGTAFAIHSGLDAKAAAVIAIPAALLGSFFELLAKTVSVFFVNAADRMAEKGDDKGISRMLHIGNLVHFLADAVPTFIALLLGANAVKTVLQNIPEWLQHGITVAGNILPALGIALLLTTLVTPGLFPFFFIGFLIAAYTKMSILGVALLAFLIAIVMQSRKTEDEDEGLIETAVTSEGVGANTYLSKKEKRQLFFRSFALQSAFSFDRMQALGFTWSLLPLLRKLYKGKNNEQFIEALKRHLAFFNTHPWIPGPIFALTADMEIRKAHGEDIDGQAIQGLKSGLMGPIAGVGDSMFHGTLRPLIGGITAGLALSGNILAPILFFVIVNAVHLFVMWYTLEKGFKLGEQFLGVLASGKTRKLMEGATTAGLMAVGALTATWLSVQTPLVYHVQKASVSIQGMLDNIMPKLLPLAVTMLVFWLIRKRLKTTSVMIGLIVVGLILGAFNILG